MSWLGALGGAMEGLGKGAVSIANQAAEDESMAKKLALIEKYKVDAENRAVDRRTDATKKVIQSYKDATLATTSTPTVDYDMAGNRIEGTKQVPVSADAAYKAMLADPNFANAMGESPDAAKGLLGLAKAESDRQTKIALQAQWQKVYESKREELGDQKAAAYANAAIGIEVKPSDFKEISGKRTAIGRNDVGWVDEDGNFQRNPAYSPSEKSGNDKQTAGQKDANSAADKLNRLRVRDVAGNVRQLTREEYGQLAEYVDSTKRKEWVKDVPAWIKNLVNQNGGVNAVSDLFKAAATGKNYLGEESTGSSAGTTQPKQNQGAARKYNVKTGKFE